MKRQVPPYIVRPSMEGADEYAQQMLERAKSYAALSALASAAQERADLLKQQLLMPVSGKRFAGAKIEFADPQTGQKLPHCLQTKCWTRTWRSSCSSQANSMPALPRH